MKNKLTKAHLILNEVTHFFYRISWKFFGYSTPKLQFRNYVESDKLNQLIYDNLTNGLLFFYIRFGETEFRAIWQHELLKNNLLKNYSTDMLTDLEKLAGFFPVDKENVSRFADFYLNNSTIATNVGVWLGVREKFILKRFFPTINVNYAEDIEPFFYDFAWTKALENKRVLVIHSFTNSIKKQFQIINLVHPNQLIPTFELLLMKPPLTTVKSARVHKDYFTELSEFIGQMDNLDFDVALVSAGSYGIPICNEIYKRGKSAMYLGGVLQLFFGIKGNRWTKQEKYKAIMNEHWIHPLREDVNDEFKLQFNSLEDSGGYW